jgi:hypothetical protein
MGNVFLKLRGKSPLLVGMSCPLRIVAESQSPILGRAEGFCAARPALRGPDHWI